MDSSKFIKMNEYIYHMYLPVIYDGNDFFIPAAPFLEIINQSTGHADIIDNFKNKLLLEKYTFTHVNNELAVKARPSYGIL